MSKKEKIDPITSVGADKGQSTRTNVIITENQPRNRKFTSISSKAT